jgi:hypothetical protein
VADRYAARVKGTYGLMPRGYPYPEGIGLGIGRHGIQIPWQEIQEIRISPAARGALADVVLLP